MTVKDINEIIKIVCPNDEDYEKPCISPKYLRQELEQLALEQEHRQLEQEPTTKNDLALIHTEGLDEEIRCTMCTNSMKSDRGCDGSCVVNNDMYKAVMNAIEKRIQPTIKNDLGVEHHKQNIKVYAHDFGVSEEQAEKELAVKNDLGVDCISREQAINAVNMCSNSETILNLQQLPTVTPQEPIMDKVKQAREKIDEMSRYTSVTGVTQYKQLNRDDVLEILDELIESEDQE